MDVITTPPPYVRPKNFPIDGTEIEKKLFWENLRSNAGSYEDSEKPDQYDLVIDETGVKDVVIAHVSENSDPPERIIMYVVWESSFYDYYWWINNVWDDGGDSSYPGIKTNVIESYMTPFQEGLPGYSDVGDFGISVQTKEDSDDDWGVCTIANPGIDPYYQSDQPAQGHNLEPTAPFPDVFTLYSFNHLGYRYFTSSFWTPYEEFDSIRIGYTIRQTGATKINEEGEEVIDESAWPEIPSLPFEPELVYVTTQDPAVANFSVSVQPPDDDEAVQGEIAINQYSEYFSTTDGIIDVEVGLDAFMNLGEYYFVAPKTTEDVFLTDFRIYGRIPPSVEQINNLAQIVSNNHITLGGTTEITDVDIVNKVLNTEISTAEDLFNIRYKHPNRNYTFAIINNIDLSNFQVPDTHPDYTQLTDYIDRDKYPDLPTQFEYYGALERVIASGFPSISGFYRSLGYSVEVTVEGNYHTISNLKMSEGFANSQIEQDRLDLVGMGLFGTFNGEINNLMLKKFSIQGSSDELLIGALVANANYLDSVKNVFVVGSELKGTGEHSLVGGLTGDSWNRLVYDNVGVLGCDISSNYMAAGIFVLGNSSTEISKAFVSNSKIDGANTAGGISCSNYDSFIGEIIIASEITGQEVYAASPSAESVEAGFFNNELINADNEVINLSGFTTKEMEFLNIYENLISIDRKPTALPFDITFTELESYVEYYHPFLWGIDNNWWVFFEKYEIETDIKIEASIFSDYLLQFILNEFSSKLTINFTENHSMPIPKVTTNGNSAPQNNRMEILGTVEDLAQFSDIYQNINTVVKAYIEYSPLDLLGNEMYISDTAKVAVDGPDDFSFTGDIFPVAARTDYRYRAVLEISASHSKYTVGRYTVRIYGDYKNTGRLGNVDLGLDVGETFLDVRDLDDIDLMDDRAELYFEGIDLEDWNFEEFQNWTWESLLEFDSFYFEVMTLEELIRIAVEITTDHTENDLKNNYSREDIEQIISNKLETVTVNEINIWNLDVGKLILKLLTNSSENFYSEWTETEVRNLLKLLLLNLYSYEEFTEWFPFDKWESVVKSKLQITRLSNASIEVVYNQSGPFKFKQDFDVGDVLTVEYPNVFRVLTRILAVKEEQNYEGTKYTLTLGKEFENLVSKIKADKDSISGRL